MSFLDLAKARYSCRNLTAKKIEPEKIDRILQAAVAAPTAVNKQPIKIWKISSADGAEKIKSVTKYTFGAGFFLVVGYKQDEAFVRPFDKKNFAEIDASIVATHIMLAVQDEGLGATWVGYFDPAKLQEVFPEMSGYEFVAIFPIGYPEENAAPSNRHEMRRSVAELVEEI